MENPSKYWWLVLLKGIVLILLAFFVFGNPAGTLLGLALYIGIALMFTGVLLIVAALSLRKVDDNWGWRLAEGVIDVVFAFILLSNPAITAAILPFVVGFWIIVYGVMLFADSFRLKKAGVGNWWLNLITGILTVVIGWIITTNFVAGALTIAMWIGIGLLLFGIVNIVLSLGMRKDLKTT